MLVVLSFFEKVFFGFFNGENTLLQKVLKKWCSFRKKITLFFFKIGGGGQEIKSFILLFSEVNRAKSFEK